MDYGLKYKMQTYEAFRKEKEHKRKPLRLQMRQGILRFDTRSTVFKKKN